MLVASLCVPAWTVAPQPVQAQTCNFSVSAINFGTVATLGSPTSFNSSGTLGVSCSKLGLLGLPLPVTITVCPNLDAGSGGSSGGARLMTGPGAPTMPFQLYQDAGRTIPWGSAKFLQFGSVPTLTLTSDNSGNISATRTLYAAANPPASDTAGTYSSTFSGEAFYWGANLLTCAGVTVGTLATPSAFTVSAVVPVNCQLSVTPMNFGSKGLLTTTATSSASLGVGCTAGAPYVISLDLGLHGVGPTQRMMVNGTQTITYGLYQDAGFTQPWGVSTPNLLGGTGVGTSQAVTIYGKVPAQTTPSPGIYTDTVVATVTY